MTTHWLSIPFTKAETNYLENQARKVCKSMFGTDATTVCLCRYSVEAKALFCEMDTADGGFVELWLKVPRSVFRRTLGF